MNAILKKLAGADRRSIGKSDEVVAEVLAKPELFGIVFAGMMDDDPVLRMRCADVIEKITVTHPELLYPYKKKLIQQVAKIEQQEVRRQSGDAGAREKVVGKIDHSELRFGKELNMRFALDFRLVTFVFLASAVFATAAWIVGSPHFAQNPDVLALALTMDMVIILPAVFYFWIVRKRRLPTPAFVPVFILAIVIAGIILPVAQQAYLDLVKKLIPLLEVLVLGFLIIKIRAITKHYRASKMTAIYSTEALAASFQHVLGASTPTNILVTELLLLYHAFGGWSKKFTSRAPEHAIFSYHRRVGYTAILCVVALLLLVETTALHLLLQHWSALAAWIFTGLSLYSLLWLIGDYHAIRLHPIVLDETHLHLRIGMRWRATIPLSEITEIQSLSHREKHADYMSVALFGSPRLVIALRQPIKIKGLFGIQKETWRLALTIDDEKRFRLELNNRLNRK